MVKARVVNDAMLYKASLAVTEMLTEKEIAEGRVFPNIERIVEVSRHVAIQVAKEAVAQGVAPELPKVFVKGREADCSFAAHHDKLFWEPTYNEVIYDKRVGDHIDDKELY